MCAIRRWLFGFDCIFETEDGDKHIFRVCPGWEHLWIRILAKFVR